MALNVLEFNRLRSQFWIKIHENENSTTLLANDMTKELIGYRFPEMEEFSRYGWKTNPGYHSLWIADSDMVWACYDEFIAWAESSGKRIWLTKNKRFGDSFIGNELDYCVAYDWNFVPETKKRTSTGEAEYQLKYNFMPTELRNHYNGILENAILSCIDCLPYDMDDFVVSPVPALKDDQGKLAWKLAEFVSTCYNIPLLPFTLSYPKPPMKNQALQKRIEIWGDILSNPKWLPVSDEMQTLVNQNNVLIVDDLYQSGASIWCLAKFLKEKLNANTVAAVTTVKALRDGDNS